MQRIGDLADLLFAEHHARFLEALIELAVGKVATVLLLSICDRPIILTLFPICLDQVMCEFLQLPPPVNPVLDVFVEVQEFLWDLEPERILSYLSANLNSDYS